MEEPKYYDILKTIIPNFSEVYSSSAKEIVKELEWKDGDDVMDYGCGSGQFAANYIAGTGKNMKICGVDISEAMINYALEMYAKDNPNLCFMVGNMMDDKGETGKFSAESIDKFISFLVLCYIKNYKLFFEKFHKLLRPGGQIGLLVPFSKAYGVPYELFKQEKWKKYEKVEKSRVEDWVYNIDDGIPDMKGCIESLGFTVSKYEVKDVALGFNNISDLCEFLSVVTAAAPRVEEELRAELMKDLEATAASYLNLDPETFPTEVGWKWLVIIAAKN